MAEMLNRKDADALLAERLKAVEELSRMISGMAEGSYICPECHVNGEGEATELHGPAVLVRLRERGDWV